MNGVHHVMRSFLRAYFSVTGSLFIDLAVWRTKLLFVIHHDKVVESMHQNGKRIYMISPEPARTLTLSTTKQQFRNSFRNWAQLRVEARLVCRPERECLPRRILPKNCPVASL